MTSPQGTGGTHLILHGIQGRDHADLAPSTPLKFCMGSASTVRNPWDLVTIGSHVGAWPPQRQPRCPPWGREIESVAALGRQLCGDARGRHRMAHRRKMPCVIAIRNAARA